MIWLWSIKFKEGNNAKNNPCGLGGGGQLLEKHSMNEKIEQPPAYLTLLKIFIRTRKSVTRSAIRPGTTSGLIRKLTQLVTTNMKLGR